MVLPKPLLPVGDVPILEVVVRQLASHGFKEIIIAVGHLGTLIMACLGDGSKYGVKIKYSIEEKMLGTSGPLALIPNLDETFLVMNGDILTTLNYSKLVNFHRKNKAIATIAMHKREVKIDFGVIKVGDKNKLIDYVEKPVLGYLVSMGVYVFEPKVLKYIKPNQKLDFPDLVKLLLEKKEKVVGYYTNGYWLDIGRPEDYAKAREDFERMKLKTFLKTRWNDKRCMGE
jgi:NDP-sugar pyrophosphorylase family protein